MQLKSIAAGTLVLLAGHASTLQSCEDGIPNSLLAPAVAACDAMPLRLAFDDEPAATSVEVSQPNEPVPAPQADAEVIVEAPAPMPAPVPVATYQAPQPAYVTPQAYQMPQPQPERRGIISGSVRRSRNAAGFAADVVTTVHPAVRFADYMGWMDRRSLGRALRGDD